MRRTSRFTCSSCKIRHWAETPAQSKCSPCLIAHIAEHIALLYRQRMEAGINMQMPPMPDFRDPKFRFNEVDPATDMLISQRAAQVVQSAPQMKQIEAIRGLGGQQGQQGNPLQYAQELAKLETESLKARTQAQIQADQAKAQSNIQIKQDRSASGYGRSKWPRRRQICRRRSQS